MVKNLPSLSCSLKYTASNKTPDEHSLPVRSWSILISLFSIRYLFSMIGAVLQQKPARTEMVLHSFLSLPRQRNSLYMIDWRGYSTYFPMNPLSNRHYYLRRNRRKPKKWAETGENVPSDICIQRRLKSLRIRAVLLESVFSAWRNFAPLPV